MRRLQVRLDRSPTNRIAVGELAEQDGRVYFEYDPTFQANRVSLSPYKLPVEAGLIEHKETQFGPLPGVFDDSLPDGWGRLLMDRYFRRGGYDPATVSPLERLAWVGTRTMGALTYHPPHELQGEDRLLDLHQLGRSAESFLAGESEDVLPQLMAAGGSPGGARPKVLVGVRGDTLLSGEEDLPEGYEHWIVKFAPRADAAHAGPVECAYALMAREAGIQMPDVRLFEVGEGRRARRCFGVKRFDRQPGNLRVHVHTFANLIHADFRVPSTDYATLLRVTHAMTRHHGDLLRAYRQMAFNVAAHNRDDHGKNFAFLLEPTNEWRLTPAYDITFAPGPGGQHAMAVHGEGLHPTREHCLELAAEVGIGTRDAVEAIDAVNAAVSQWSTFAEEAACPGRVRSEIAARLRPL